jgi:CHAP domain
MPNLVVGSAQEALDKLKSQWGVWWPNPWWPTGNSSYNDCAACMSWCLFNLNGNQPYYTYVSEIQNWGAGIGVKHMGGAGMQPGDVVGFDWTGDGGYDHTEMVVSVSGSSFVSRGTNSSGGDDLIDRQRSTSQVLSYVRPPYAGSQPAPQQMGDEEMRVISVPNGTVALVGEYTGHKYTSASGGEGFSLVANQGAYGLSGNLTEDQVTTLVNEAGARRSGLIDDIIAEIGYQPPSQTTEKRVGALFVVAIIGVVLLLVALGVSIWSAYINGTSVSLDSISTTVKVIIGVAAALLGFSAGGTFANRNGHPQWVPRPQGKHSDDFVASESPASGEAYYPRHDAGSPNQTTEPKETP